MRPVVRLLSRGSLALVTRSYRPRSRSVSAPSSVTKTSPCWNGLIVPGSTLRYGSHFCRVTLKPRLSRRQPIEEAATPFPSEETTPPVTKIYFGAILIARVALPGLFALHRSDVHIIIVGTRNSVKSNSSQPKIVIFSPRNLFLGNGFLSIGEYSMSSAVGQR